MPVELNQIAELLQGYLPKLIAALAVLVFGWLAALVITAIIRGGLRRTGLDNRLVRWVLGEERVQEVNVEQWITKGVF